MHFGNARRLYGEGNSRVLQNFAAAWRGRGQDKHDRRFYRKLGLDEFNAIAEES